MTEKSAVFVIGLLLLSAATTPLTGCDALQGRKVTTFESGRELFEAGQILDARAELRKTVQIDDRHAEAWYLLGRIAEGLGQPQRALNRYAAALTADPLHADAQIRRTHLLAVKGELTTAHKAIDEVLAVDPNHGSGLVARGDVRRRRGDIEGAKADARRVLAEDPHHVGAVALLARAQLDQGSSSQARRTLDQAMAVLGPDPMLMLNLAAVHERTGDYDAAITVYGDVVKRHPDLLPAVNNLALLLAQHPSDAAAMDRALELAGRLRGSGVPEYLDTLGWIYHLRGNHEEAVKYLDRAAKRRSDNTEILYHLGAALAANGEHSRARRQLGLAAAAPDPAIRAKVEAALSALPQ